jgi:hypothetical protein
MFSREPHADVEQEMSLIWRARLLAADATASIDGAVVELRELAEGRADLLAAAAGSQIGTYLASPRTTDPHRLLAGALLVMAGADSDLIEDAVESVRRWTGSLAHGAA